MMLSLVVPCYNERENVRSFYNACITAFEGSFFSYEIIFINDGELVAVGNHEYLLEHCPEYQRTVELQRLEDERK